MSYFEEDITLFYQTQRGCMVKDCLKPYAHAFLKNISRHEIILHIGYSPYSLDEEIITKNTIIHLTPHTLFNSIKSHQKKKHDLIIHDGFLPFPNQQIDKIIITHALEFSNNTHIFLDECRRILTKNGKILLIVPNRQSLWAWSEKTPFGHGHPYTMNQLENLLALKHLQIVRKGYELLCLKIQCILKHKKIFSVIMRILNRFFKKFSGVHIVEIEKRSPIFLVSSRTIPKKQKKPIPLFNHPMH